MFTSSRLSIRSSLWDAALSQSHDQNDKATFVYWLYGFVESEGANEKRDTETSFEGPPMTIPWYPLVNSFASTFLAKRRASGRSSKRFITVRSWTDLTWKGSCRLRDQNGTALFRPKPWMVCSPLRLICLHESWSKVFVQVFRLE